MRSNELHLSLRFGPWKNVDFFIQKGLYDPTHLSLFESVIVIDVENKVLEKSINDF